MEVIFLMKLLIDCTIIIDYLIPIRRRHNLALEMIEKLQVEYILSIPAHQYFELCNAIIQEYNYTNKLSINNNLIVKNIDIIPINKQFCLKYMKKPWLNLKAADMIYGVIATHDKIPLITEDNNLYITVNNNGGKAYKIEEALIEFNAN